MMVPLIDMLGQHAAAAAATVTVTDEGASSHHHQSQWTIPEDEIARRRDLREYRIFTIDPPTAKDLDDALHITDLGDGIYSIGSVLFCVLFVTAYYTINKVV